MVWRMLGKHRPLLNSIRMRQVRAVYDGTGALVFYVLLEKKQLAVISDRTEV